MGEQTSSSSAARVLAGRYRLDVPLGEGASAELYRATDLRQARTVSVEILHVEGGSRRERLVREVKRASQVKHPSLVEVIDVGRTEEGAPFVVTEMIEGERLSERLSRCHELDPALATAIATQICAALAAAHDAGVVHRDIRPSRVTLVGDGPAVKVHGLGMPSAPPSEDDRYAAPEHRRGEPVGRRADVYSIGAIVQAMLIGSPPREGPAADRTRGPLGAVVARCLSEDPRERYVDTGELEDALLEALAPKGSKAPATSRPPSVRSHPPSLRSPPSAPSLATTGPPAPVRPSPPRPSSRRVPPAAPSAEPLPRSQLPSSTPRPGDAAAAAAREQGVAPGAPAATPTRPLGRPLAERSASEELVHDLRNGPVPPVVIALVLAFALARIASSGVVPWIAAAVAGAAAYAAWRYRRSRSGTRPDG